MGEKTSNLIQAIIVITAAFILVAGFVISYFVYFNRRKSKLLDENESMKKDFQQQLLQSQIEVQEATLSALSKELHDNVGQLLSTSRMLLGLTERSLPNPPDTLLTANATIGEAIQEIRSLSKSLDKEWLERFSFNDNLQSEINRINSGNKVAITYHQPVQIPLPPEEQIILFRIVQEAIQNAIRHAGAEQISVKGSIDDRNLQVLIRDNGCGFDESSKTPGMGLSNMRNRTRLLRGHISWSQEQEKGTCICIEIPVKQLHS